MNGNYLVSISTEILLMYLHSRSNITDRLQRAWIAGSNIIFILPVLYAYRLTRKKRLPFYDLLPEILICSFTGITSCLYHLCSNGPFCTKWCLGQTIPNGEYQSPAFIQLQHWDFTLSYMCVLMAFSYSTDHFLSVVKIVFLGFGFLMCVVYCNTPYFGRYDILFYSILIVYGIVFTVIRFSYYYIANRLTHEMTYHFDKTMGVCALLFLVIGITCYVLFNPLPFKEYGWGHPCWHISICLAIFFEFAMYDREAAFPCYHVRNPCPECDREGGTDYVINRDPFHTTEFFGLSLTPWKMHHVQLNPRLIGQDPDNQLLAYRHPAANQALENRPMTGTHPTTEQEQGNQPLADPNSVARLDPETHPLIDTHPAAEHGPENHPTSNPHFTANQVQENRKHLATEQEAEPGSQPKTIPLPTCNQDPESHPHLPLVCLPP